MKKIFPFIISTLLIILTVINIRFALSIDTDSNTLLVLLVGLVLLFPFNIVALVYILIQGAKNAGTKLKGPNLSTMSLISLVTGTVLVILDFWFINFYPPLFEFDELGPFIMWFTIVFGFNYLYTFFISYAIYNVIRRKISLSIIGLSFLIIIGTHLVGVSVLHNILG